MQPAELIEVLASLVVAYQVIQTGYIGMTKATLPLGIPLTKRIVFLHGRGQWVAAVGNIFAGVVLAVGLLSLLAGSMDTGGVFIIGAVLLIIVSDIAGYVLTKPRPLMLTESEVRRRIALRRQAEIESLKRMQSKPPEKPPEA